MTHSWSRSAATGVIMVLFIVTQCCYYSAAISTNGFKEVVDSGKKGIVSYRNSVACWLCMLAVLQKACKNNTMQDTAI